MRTLMISLALLGGSAIGCHSNKTAANRTTTAQAPQTQSPPCNNVSITGQAGNPNCENGGVSGTNTNADATRSNGPLGGQPTTPEK